MTALFDKKIVVHSSLREQIKQVERSIKTCIEAMKKAYDLLWETQNERNFLAENITKLKRAKTDSSASELTTYEAQLAQMDCDLEYLRKDLQEEKPEQVVRQLQERLEQLKEEQNAISGPKQL